MRSYIYLKDLRFHAFHGVMPQERLTGGDFAVDVRVGYPIHKAMETDNVADTLNYADIYEIINKEMRKPSRLLEHLAGRIGGSIIREMPQVEEVSLSVTKLNPPIGADCGGAGVELHLINDKTQ